MRSGLRTLAAFLLVAGLAACAVGEGMEAREFHRMADNEPDGPGLLTGEEGAFILYRR